ncbi:HlyD family type I secretion periplasmic adaptor subunit (plasmid) [Roseobacter denitrificans]|uniref:Membrane fusion protein (MFP) family protein n=1 Tax=Roseobacter denitrificans (strain ATCC 33942 / OCh 114) TaxID=375451 RepID=Q07GH6_ROSDO|nr:HlyD family type I secretion periplasmic adaptor subunit [Roseobacter denitrificans]ABI93423.1 HlyD family secretion protein [Roseobacter denitrificans OCh 114]AVL55101.1 HlyD family type I secretion periplasmic adaptor subunit [Roseobacter denitrificans]SFG44076.1 HlyD family secretion protein [Roseobacter denitrificans OCh 114]
MTTLAAQDDLTLRLSMRSVFLAGLIGLVALLGGVGFWAGTTLINGAVIAQGQAVVRGNAKQVQHLDGGIVADILVQDGDGVQAGDVLIRLDPTLVRMNLDVTRQRLADALTQQARLRAEQQGLGTLTFVYPDLPFEMPDMAANEAGQRAIFTARAAVQTGGRDQLAEAFRQFENQIEGLTSQMEAISAQIGFVSKDLDNMQVLVERNLARQSQLNDLNRTRADLEGRRAALASDIAQLSNARREAEIQTLQSERSFQESVVTDLRTITSQVDELILDIVTRAAQLDRINIRAPAAGIVHELQISTVGGVIDPGQVIAEIIPQDQALDFELRVQPQDIDQVYIGQEAETLIAAFDVNETPKLIGSVARISPNAIVDPQTGQSYYLINLTVPAEEIARLGGLRIKPGMPVEAYLATGERTVLGYLISPVTTQMRRAFRQ